MNTQIIFASLRARPVRTLVGVLAVGLEVTLILVVVGLTVGIANETGKRIAGIGSDLMLMPPNSSVLLGMSSSVMPESLGPKIQELEGVKAVSPLLVQTNSESGIENVFGIDMVTFDAATGGFIFREGKIFSPPEDGKPDEIVVDNIYAQARQVRIGSQISVLNHKFKISGIVENGKGARLFIPLKTAQEITGRISRTSVFLIKLHNTEEHQAVIDRLGKLLPTYPARYLPEYLSLMTSQNIPGLDAFLSAVVFIAVCIGVLVIFLSMYTTVTERTREIGILRSMGASKGFIVKLVLQESVLLCVVGVVVGYGISTLTAQAVPFMYPTLAVLITFAWMWKAAGFAILSGIVGSLYPAVKAAAQDPIEALAYE